MGTRCPWTRGPTCCTSRSRTWGGILCCASWRPENRSRRSGGTRDEAVRLRGQRDAPSILPVEDDPFLHHPAVSSGVESLAGGRGHELIHSLLRQLQHQRLLDEHCEDLPPHLERHAARPPAAFNAHAWLARDRRDDGLENRRHLDPTAIGWARRSLRDSDRLPLGHHLPTPRTTPDVRPRSWSLELRASTGPRTSRQSG